MLNSADPALRARLETVAPGAVIEGDSSYFQEPRDRWSGQGLVVAPRSTQEVAEVAKICHKAAVPIVPYSGGTGLVGGQIAEGGPRPVILSLRRMNTIRDVLPRENAMLVDAGVILADVWKAAEDVGRLFPLTLGSWGSARIGGLLATNAGGLNVVRYGMARAQCLGLEVVTADGRIWDGLTRLRKDNAGYDLRDLMIGSEGTLGIITGAALRLYPRLTSVATAFLSVPSPDAALELLGLVGDQVGDNLSAFELIGGQGFRFLTEVGPEVRWPMDPAPEWSVLLELGLPGGLDASAAMEQLFEVASEQGLVRDGVIAQSESQRDALWDLREALPEANRRIGPVSSHDVSLPLSEIPGFIEAAPAALAKVGEFRINCFGHVGDGNLHYNVFPVPGRSRDDHLEDRAAVKRCVHDLVHARGGSIAAEHGVGRLKVDDLARYAHPEKLRMMRDIKAALDPKGILNPGAVLARS